MNRERGASLVSLLVVLVTLGGLSVLALAARPTDPAGRSNPLHGSTARGESAGQGGSGATPTSERSPTEGAGVAACLATAQTVATAAAAKHAAGGAHPATVAELVAGGWLASAPALRGYELTVEASGGRPTGRILVNGLPAEQGCAAGPHAHP